MKTYKSGSQVGYGLYVAPGALDVRFVGAEGETLEGKADAKYFRLPALLMILASPVIGGVFVLAFPLIVLMIAAYAVVQFFGNKASEAVGNNSHLAFMRWEPTAAYLKKTGKKDNDGKKDSQDKKN